MISEALQLQSRSIKNNKLTFFLIVLTAFASLFVAFTHGKVIEACFYLLAMWFFSLFADMYAVQEKVKATAGDFIVRDPKKETFYFLICLLLGQVFFFFRFSGVVVWESLNGILKLAIFPLIIFVFPIALAAIMLKLKYKLPELGIKWRGLILVVPVIIISAAINRLVSPESLTWDALMKEEGSIAGMFFSGIIVAGLSEEFFRMIGQTRIGAFLKNKALGWYIASFIWAFMHLPKWYSDDHDLNEAIMGSLRIIPIGLMWGYLTHRTKSILPSVIVHGTNFWGLQNF